MQIQRAFTLPFDDPRWLHKLLPLLPLTLFTLLPIVGLIPLAVILGWLISLISNIRQGNPRPLPEWRDMSLKITWGADVLVLMILAHLPLIAVFIVAAALGGSIGSTVYSLLYNVGQLCCLVPISLVYSLVMWLLVGLSVLDYSDSHRRADLYHFAYQWDRARSNANLLSGWLIRVLAVNALCALLLLIPILGWVIAPVIIWPTQGILLGELGRLLDGRMPRKKER